MIRKTIKVKRILGRKIGGFDKMNAYEKVHTIWLLFIPLYSWSELYDVKIS